MTSPRDEIIRTALHAIERGMSVEQAISNATDSALEYRGVRRALRDHPGVRQLTTPEEIDQTAMVTANRRMEPAPPTPTGKHTDSGWWGRKKS